MIDKIKGLDGLRGLSVLLVIASHAVLLPRIGLNDPSIGAIFSAHVGVSTFFVLSGFLITHLLIKEKEATGKIDLGSFYIRRALRIFPLYYLALSILTFLDYIGKANVPNCAYPYAFLYAINFSPRECSYSSLSHFWSLAVEEHFYMIWPFIFLAGRRPAALALIAFLALWAYFGSTILPPASNYYVNRWTYPAALPIVVGCTLAFICEHKRVSAFFSNQSHSAVLLIAILAGLTTPAITKNETPWLISASALLLYVFHNQGSLLVRILEKKPLATLGTISYGLYVWQGVFTGNGPYRTGMAFPPPLETGLILTFIIAPISYLFFEKPLLRIKSRFSWKTKISPIP